MNFLQCTLIDFLFLPSVTSPKEVKASFKDFSSTDQDKPARHISIITSTIIKATYAQETKREYISLHFHYNRLQQPIALLNSSNT